MIVTLHFHNIVGSDHDRWDESIAEFNKLKAKPALKYVPICILANKQDLPKSKSKEDVVKSFDAESTKEQPILVIETSMVEDKGITEALAWVDSIMKTSNERTSYRKSIAEEEPLPENVS